MSTVKNKLHNKSSKSPFLIKSNASLMDTIIPFLPMESQALGKPILSLEAIKNIKKALVVSH